MNKRRLLATGTAELQTSQRAACIFADIDIGIAQLEQLTVPDEGAADPQKISLASYSNTCPTYIVTDGFSSSRTASSYNCHDCFLELAPGEVPGLENRMLVDAESTVDVDTVLSRRGLSGQSGESRDAE